MKRSIRLLSGALAAVFFWNAAAAARSTAELDSYSLQYDFGTATDLVIESRWQNIPDDAAVLLKYVGTQFAAGKPGFANIGEEWSDTDAVMVYLPQAQHLFSAYSDRVVASIFLLGGNELKVYALLARRHAENFCIFRLPRLALSNLRASIVQDILRPDRDQTISSIPNCQPQSLRQPLHLTSH